MAKPQQKQTSTHEEDMAAELLLKEADEALRQDQMQAFWNEWGSTIVGIAIMIVLGTILGVSWQKWRISNYTEETSKLIMLQTRPEADIIPEGSYGGIANLLEAATLATSDDRDANIISALMQKAADSGLPREWDIMAEWGALRSQVDTVDTADVKIEIADKMVSLANKRKNPFTPAILMEAAIIKGQNGEAKEAVALLEKASANPVTAQIPALGNRIDSYLQLYKTETAE